MTDTDAGGSAAPQPQAAPQMKVKGQFIRDMSFENIMAQNGMKGDIQPDVNVQVGLDGKNLPAPNEFEVSIKLTISSKSKTDDSMMFMLELDYAGIFHIENVPTEQLHPFLLIECPRMIFPFLRRIVSDVTRDGGFPPLNLETIDFVNLYRKEMMRQQAEKAASNGQSSTDN